MNKPALAAWRHPVNVSGVAAFLFLFLLFSGCSPVPKSRAYSNFYSHLSTHNPALKPLSKSDYFLILLVEARHLDYTSGKSLFKTIAKHPRDGSKNGDVGHAWIYLRGLENGKALVVEGGHSGELGRSQARYFDGIMNNLEFGYSNPTYYQAMNPRFEPNPVKYLWESQKDGFFQKGSGGHRPTYAIKINLTDAQFHSILNCIDPRHYDYSNYALTGGQCTSFSVLVAELAGLELACDWTFPIPQILSIGGERFTLWSDPIYSSITLASPDLLEKNMMRAVEEGNAEYALPWYLKNRYKKMSPRCHWSRLCRTFRCFPKRYRKYLSLQRRTVDGDAHRVKSIVDIEHCSGDR